MTPAAPSIGRVRIETPDHLEPDALAEVQRLVREATAHDGLHPLSEHATLHLRTGVEASGRSALLWVDGPDGTTLAGFGHLDLADEVAGASAEVVVRPAFRRQGHAAALVERMLALTPDGRLRLWAHGGHPGASALARRLGFERMRELWQMRRSLLSPLPAASPPLSLPPGVSVRTFRPGQDDEQWVALNRRAFRDHPEQGAWTLADLRRRMEEPWFDPDGFFLAERDGTMVGFHWTKVHGDVVRDVVPADAEAAHGHGAAHGHEALGEVYVVGVDPAAQGLGLGRALTLVGLCHLRERGLAAAMLYVDATNTAAVRLYTDLGFSRWDVDVMFRRSGDDQSPTG